MLSKKGFLFIEGSIMMVTVTGILSAAIFPSLTAYLARGRDTSRIAGIKEISIATEAYQIDNGHYPVVPISGCVPAKDLVKYIPNIPKDPTAGRITSGCDGSDGMTYSYRTINNKNGAMMPLFAADLESTHAGGNSSLSLDEIMELADPMKHIDSLRKGAGSSYIIHN